MSGRVPLLRRGGRAGLGLLLPLILAIGWEIAVASGAASGRLLPPPSRIAATLWGLAVSGDLWMHVEATLVRVGLGFLCGAAAGFTSQIAHAGGPPFQIYVLPRRLPRDAFIGTSAIFFATVNWMKVPAYVALGAFTPKVLATAGVLLPLAIASTWAGVWVVRRVPAEGFYRVIYVLLVVVGGKLVLDGARGLIA